MKGRPDCGATPAPRMGCHAPDNRGQVLSPTLLAGITSPAGDVVVAVAAIGVAHGAGCRCSCSRCRNRHEEVVPLSRAPERLNPDVASAAVPAEAMNFLSLSGILPRFLSAMRRSLQRRLSLLRHSQRPSVSTVSAMRCTDIWSSRPQGSPLQWWPLSARPGAGISLTIGGIPHTRTEPVASGEQFFLLRVPLT